MNKKVILWLLGALLLLILQASLFLNVIFLGLATGFSTPFSDAERKTFEEYLVEGESGADKKIAIIDLRGIISYSTDGLVGLSMVDDIVSQLRQANKDARVAAIILNVDSPGGEITASDNLSEEIKKADQTKPVLVYMNSVAASGAYYVSLGARHIVASELCITGSIGVILQTINYEKLANWVGIQTLTFKSGKMKDLLNPSRPMTEEEKAYVQGLINESYGKFVNIVAQRRKMNEQSLRFGIADGRIVSGQTAAREGLIDQVGYLSDAIAKAREFAKLKANSPVVRYVAPFRIGQLFRIFGKAPETKVSIQITPESLRLEAGKFYYLSPHLFSKF